jgi:hypothetical protein
MFDFVHRTTNITVVANLQRKLWQTFFYGNQIIESVQAI